MFAHKHLETAVIILDNMTFKFIFYFFVAAAPLDNKSGVNLLFITLCFVQNAGGIIGKGGSNIKRLRTDV